MKHLIILAALAAGIAHAEFKDGNKLLTQIKGDAMDYVHANGYVIGVYDSLHSIVFCPPNNVTAGQVTDMVKNYLEANPDQRHLSADRHVAKVLGRAWPCAKNNKGGV